jgi:hypothetical protein
MTKRIKWKKGQRAKCRTDNLPWTAHRGIEKRRKGKRQQQRREHAKEIRQGKEIDKMLKRATEAAAPAERFMIGRALIAASPAAMTFTSRAGT